MKFGTSHCVNSQLTGDLLLQLINIPEKQQQQQQNKDAGATRFGHMLRSTYTLAAWLQQVGRSCPAM